MILLNLFLSFFKIGLFSFGGGYAMIPLIQREVISTNPWVTNTEFLDMLAIAQMTPGPVAINTATFVGHNIGGILGAVVSTIAVVMPSFIIVISLSYIVQRIGESNQLDYIYKGLRPAVLALIFSAVYTIGMESIVDYKTVGIAILSFVLLKYKRANLFVIIIISGVIGMLIY